MHAPRTSSPRRAERARAAATRRRPLRARWRTGGRRSLLALAVVTMLFGSPLGVAGAGADPVGVPKVDYSGVWRIDTTVINDSSYDLRLLAQTASEETPWGRPPQPQVASRSTAAPTFVTNQVAGHGLAMLLTYGAYRPGTDEFVGMVVLKSGIACEGAMGIACVDYHRWEVGACDAGGALGLSWGDNSAPPDAYQTWFRITDGGGGCEGRRTATEELDPVTGPVPNAPWGVTQFVGNRSPFELRLNTYWASEASIIDGAPGRPPARIIHPGDELAPAWMLVNYAPSHGPAVLAMYDAFDTRTGSYAGSVIGEAAVDCYAGVPTRGCLSGMFRVNAVAAARPGYHLVATNTWNCCPPFDLSGQMGITGGFGAPMPVGEDGTSTTTTTSTTATVPAPVPGAAAAPAAATAASPRFTG